MNPRDSGPRNALRLGRAALGLLTILLANVLFLEGIGDTLDPVLAMEPFYIDLAAHPLSDLLKLNVSWGPLYALWMKPLFWFSKDPLEIYYLNLSALSLCVSCGLYLFLLPLTRRPLLSTVAALVFLVSHLNVPMPGKSGLFSLLVLLLFGIRAFGIQRGGSPAAWLAAGALLASYARPELILAAIVGLLVLSYDTFRPASARDGREGLLLLSLAVLLALTVGLPGLPRGTDPGRLFIAFQEHFAWNSRALNPEAPDDLFAIWQREFGNSETIMTAVVSNPWAVLQHIGANAFGIMRYFAQHASDHYPFLDRWLPTVAEVESGALTLMIWAVIVLTLVSPERRIRLRDLHGPALAWVIILGLPGLAAALVVYPTPQYLLMPTVSLLIVATLCADSLFPDRLGTALRSLSFAALLMILIPRPFAVSTHKTPDDSADDSVISTPRRIVDTVRMVRDLSLPRPTILLTVTEGIGAMLGADFREFRVRDRGSRPLRDFMQDTGIMLVVNLEPGRNSLLANDPFWGELQMDPKRAGFRRIPVPGHPTVGIFVRADLIPDES